jgi:hypothetical protein
MIRQCLFSRNRTTPITKPRLQRTCRSLNPIPTDPLRQAVRPAAHSSALWVWGCYYVRVTKSMQSHSTQTHTQHTLPRRYTHTDTHTNTHHRHQSVYRLPERPHLSPLFYPWRQVGCVKVLRVVWCYELGGIDCCECNGKSIPYEYRITGDCFNWDWNGIIMTL